MGMATAAATRGPINSNAGSHTSNKRVVRALKAIAGEQQGAAKASSGGGRVACRLEGGCRADRPGDAAPVLLVSAVTAAAAVVTVEGPATDVDVAVGGGDTTLVAGAGI